MMSAQKRADILIKNLKNTVEIPVNTGPPCLIKRLKMSNSIASFIPAAKIACLQKS